MASSRPASIALLFAVLALATACATTDPGDQQPERTSGSASEQASVGAATTTPSPPPGGGATINVPDLSGVQIDCAATDQPCEPGDDPELDRLWTACEDGDGGACDRLYYDAPFDTRYEQFGNTCGDRDARVPCPEQLAS